MKPLRDHIYPSSEIPMVFGGYIEWMDGVSGRVKDPVTVGVQQPARIATTDVANVIIYHLNDQCLDEA